ncbi:DUF2568 domain-containing protein [Nocardia yamanashiensis]|uniref:DUF2568 domain-containing protein n=1 Tax=Nocardia yamanashiensis TaxID=209247 RepID=UPI00082CBEED|nr:DUF2568 domain-containing protein [Nocardia yamanashiensis]
MTVLRGANLLLMFLLELAVLAAAAWWGATLDAPLPIRILTALAAPALFITIWALFGAAKDARYPQTGWRRALLELIWFGAAALLLAFAWTPLAGALFVAIWIVNGLLRIAWGQVHTQPGR